MISNHDMKKKVLIVGGFPSPNTPIFGGIVTSCQTLLNSSFADHYELILVDSTQISNPPPSIGVRGWLAFRRCMIFVKKFFSEKPDAVILFTADGLSVIEKGTMAWLVKLKKTPVFLFPRAGNLITAIETSHLKKFVFLAAMRGATHILCQGPAWQRFTMDILKLSKENSPIIYNWTSTPEMLALGELRASTPKNTTPSLLFLGWLEREKGIHELLDATLDLSYKYKFHLIIAGKGHAEEQARNFVQNHNLQKIIEFVGWVEGQEKEKLLSKSDILILPSWAEGFPNAIIEAMSAKLAVIVTTVGMIPDLIENNRQALLIPPKNKEELKLAIEKLLCDRQFREQLAENGHVFARDNFSVEQSVAKLTTTIDEAITKGKAISN